MWWWWLINQDVKLQLDSSKSHSIPHGQYCKLVFYFWIPDVGKDRQFELLELHFWGRTNTWKGIQLNLKLLGLKSGHLCRTFIMLQINTLSPYFRATSLSSGSVLCWMSLQDSSLQYVLTSELPVIAMCWRWIRLNVFLRLCLLIFAH